MAQIAIDLFFVWIAIKRWSHQLWSRLSRYLAPGKSQTRRGCTMPSTGPWTPRRPGWGLGWCCVPTGPMVGFFLSYSFGWVDTNWGWVGWVDMSLGWFGWVGWVIEAFLDRRRNPHEKSTFWFSQAWLTSPAMLYPARLNVWPIINFQLLLATISVWVMQWTWKYFRHPMILLGS